MEFYRRCQEYLNCVILLYVSIHMGSAKLTEISTRKNSAANFYLPTFHNCGSYYFTDPSKSEVLKVSEEGKITTSGLYSNRSTVTTLGNGTILFTLHFISCNDEGTFTTKAWRNDCKWIFTLSLLQEANEIAFWEEWNSWSPCSTTCDAGVRTRTRQCSNSHSCCHGSNSQTEPCDTKTSCPFWGHWGSWSICSATCGLGQLSRRRQCQIGHTIVHDDTCPGEAPSQVSRCRVNACPRWDSWSDWSACSVSCGTGRMDRHRYCLLNKKQVPTEQCSGDPAETKSCGNEQCTDTPYFWSTWTGWSTCSRSCGVGNQTRTRSCLLWRSRQTVHENYCSGNAVDVNECRGHECLGSRYLWSTWSGWSRCSSSCGAGNKTRMRSCLEMESQRQIPEQYCTGNAVDISECQEGQCLVGNTEKTSHAGSSADKDTTENPVPYTTIIGGGIAGFIIVLLLVIIVLLIRLRYKKDTAVRRRTVYEMRQSKQVDVRSSKSCADRSETGSRMYAEIDSDFLDSEFDATSCNDYGPLPSASPLATTQVTTQGQKKNSSDQTVGGNIFTFDAETIKHRDKLSIPVKSANAIRPRKVDGDGYETPVSSLERQQQLAYETSSYANIIKKI